MKRFRVFIVISVIVGPLICIYSFTLLLPVLAQIDVTEDTDEIIGQTIKHIQELTDELFYSDRFILILSATEDYNEAFDLATEASQRLGMKFDNAGREYSEEKGIYFAQDYADELYRGKYIPRGNGQDFISLENASGYRGLGSGYIIVVGGVFEDKESAEQALGRIKEFYADAFVAKTAIWTGGK